MPSGDAKLNKDMQLDSDENQNTKIIFRGDRWKKPGRARADFPENESTNEPCKIKTECGVCKSINDEYKESLDSKFKDGINVLEQFNGYCSNQVKPVPAERKLGYRCHAKLAVRKSDDPDNRFSIGLFKPESHDIVDIENCPLHRASINRLIADLKPCLQESSIEPYIESENSGDLRYLAVRASHHTEEVMITFVMTNKSHKEALKRMVMELRNQGHVISSAHININSDVTNVIFGTTSSRIMGTDRLRESICDLSFEIGPTSFFQVNPWQAETIYRRVEQLAGFGNNKVAWDLYCGTGQIAMLLAKAGYRSLGIEVNPQATRDAQKNSIRNQIMPPPSFITGKVEELQTSFPDWATEPELIVVNPARKGLAPEVRTYLRNKITTTKCQLIYISCEMETLARDLKEICQGEPKLRQVESFDMFPFTKNMEWLAVIS